MMLHDSHGKVFLKLRANGIEIPFVIDNSLGNEQVGMSCCRRKLHLINIRKKLSLHTYASSFNIPV